MHGDNEKASAARGLNGDQQVERYGDSIIWQTNDGVISKID